MKECECTFVKILLHNISPNWFWFKSPMTQFIMNPALEPGATRVRTHTRRFQPTSIFYFYLFLVYLFLIRKWIPCFQNLPSPSSSLNYLTSLYLQHMYRERGTGAIGFYWFLRFLLYKVSIRPLRFSSNYYDLFCMCMLLIS